MLEESHLSHFNRLDLNSAILQVNEEQYWRVCQLGI